MRFLFPSFLFALLAIAIPIIVHLFNFRRFRKVYFSNVRFLKSVQEQTASSKNLKNRLILASRIFAIIFLVLAFARPYLISSSSGEASRQKIVSIYIDNSYSMEGVNRQGTLLDEARRRAKEVASAYSPNDRFQLLTNDFEGRHQRLLDYESFANAVDEVKISAAAKDIGQIVGRQQDISASEPNADKAVFLISDFQNNMMPDNKIQIDSAVSVRLLRVTANDLPNVSVDSVWFVAAVKRPGEAGKLVARLRNNSTQAAKGVPLKLLINGRQRAIGNMDIAARGSATDTLSFSGLEAGQQFAEIVVTDYPVVFDDRFYFSFNVRPQLNVLVVNGTNPNPYIQAVYNSDSYFKLKNSPAGNINYSEISTYPLVILDEMTEFPSGLVQQLKAFAERGGNLLVLPALNGSNASLNNLLNTLQTDLAGQTLVADKKVTTINLRHPVFQGVFEIIPQNIDLPQVKKYLSFTAASNTNRQNLLALPGGEAFLSEYKVGKGRVYLSAVPLDDSAGNFARHSLFVPIMYQLALLSSNDQRLYFTLGKDRAAEIPNITLNNSQTLRLKHNSFEAIPDVRQTENTTQIYVEDQLKEPGNYQLLKGDSLLTYLSFNHPAGESDLSYARDEALLSTLPPKQTTFIDSTDGAVQSAVTAANEGIQLWKLCIILALLCLAAEILLLRFLSVQDGGGTKQWQPAKS